MKKSGLSLSLLFLLIHLLQFSLANSFQDSASSPGGGLESPSAAHAVLNLLVANRKLVGGSAYPQNPEDSNAELQEDHRRRRSPSGHSPGVGNGST